MLVQVKKKIAATMGRDGFASHGVLVGSRFYTHEDGAFDVDHKKAQELIKQGLVDAVVELPASAAQRATAPKIEAQRR